MNEPGWFPDPQGSHELRYWDGAGWTDFVSDHGQQATDPLTAAVPPPPPAPPARTPSPPGGPRPEGFENVNWSPPEKKSRKVPIWAWVVGGIAALFVIAAISGGSESEQSSDAQQETASESSDNSEEESKQSASKSGDDDCGDRATDDCTPHMSSGESVRVDALIWRVEGARTTKTLGNQEFGLGEKADGRFLVVTLQVRSDRDESATLTNDVVQLEVNGNTYDTDTEGTVAAAGAGEDPFFLEDIGPDSTTTGKVVFDVPPSVLSEKLELRFNELGFGSTHGFIRLPTPSASS